MLDRLMPVVDEFAWRPASLPVEVNGGAGGEDAGGDAREQAFGAADEVAFESQLVFERLDDRFDSLAERADRRPWPVGFVGSGWAEDEGAELADGLLELAAGKAFVAEDELAAQWLALEQGDAGFALGRVGGDEAKSTIVPSGPQSRTSRIPQNQREWAGE
jgi:hypothetical protein